MDGAARLAAVRVARGPARSAPTRAGGRRRAGAGQARHHRRADPVQGGDRLADGTPAQYRGQCRHDAEARARHGDADHRLWHGARPDDGAQSDPRRVLHQGRPARGARAQQPHLPPLAPAVAALSPGAAHGWPVARHRARHARRRSHHPHGIVAARADHPRAAARVRPARLLLQLDLRADRAGHRRLLHVVHVLGVRAAHRHPPRDERQRHRRQHQGDRQPVELRDRQILRQ